MVGSCRDGTRVDRDVGLALPAVARCLLPAGPAAAPRARPPGRAREQRRDQRLVLLAAAARVLPGLGGGDPRRLPCSPSRAAATSPTSSSCATSACRSRTSSPRACSRSGPKLGPVLWQLPPRLRFDAARIDEFLTLLPRSTAAAAAAGGRARRAARRAGRDRRRTPTARCGTRWRSATRASATRRSSTLLRAHDVALVVADTAGTLPYLEDVTAGFVYVRLHGDTRALHQRLLARGARPLGREGAGVAGGGVAGR